MNLKVHLSIQRWVKIYVLLVIITGISHAVLAQTMKGSIQIGISADTNVFVWGEDIWLYVTVQNIMPKGISIPDPNQTSKNVMLELTDQYGDKLQSGITSYAIGTTYAQLPPNGSIEEPYSLLSYVNDRSGDSPGTRLLPGTYTAKATLKDAFSDEFTFRIVSPTAEQRLVAEEIFEKIIKWKSMKQAVENAKMLIRRYPHSVYLPNIYSRTLNRGGFKELALDFIQKFARRPEVQTALYSYLKAFRNQIGIGRGQKLTMQQWSTIERELWEIKARIPEERLSRYIDDIIRNNKPQ